MKFRRIKKWFLCFLTMCIVLDILMLVPVRGEPVQEGETDTSDEIDTLITSPHGILLEATTGTVLYEKDADTKVRPASITKIMTLLLIYEELEKGTIKKEDMVTTSAHAKSMGGSQVFLEEGEQQTVETMIKSIVIASGNDASVAMAEHISGSEGAFVERMNERAAELGMEHTHFEDCCGLTESENHYTTARDVGIVSAALVSKYPDVLQYSSIWMDTMIHRTAKGESEFGLTNTNKLVRSYEGCVGLKTGSTSLAKYCVSAVAVRGDVMLISVVMTAPDYKVRFQDAAAMLNMGFSTCQYYEDDNPPVLEPVPVEGNIYGAVEAEYEDTFCFVDTKGRDLATIEAQLILEETILAPVEKGQKLGECIYYLDGEELGRIGVVASEELEKSQYLDYVKWVGSQMMTGSESS